VVRRGGKEKRGLPSLHFYSFSCAGSREGKRRGKKKSIFLLLSNHLSVGALMSWIVGRKGRNPSSHFLFSRYISQIKGGGRKRGSIPSFFARRGQREKKSASQPSAAAKGREGGKGGGGKGGKKEAILRFVLFS